MLSYKFTQGCRGLQEILGHKDLKASGNQRMLIQNNLNYFND